MNMVSINKLIEEKQMELWDVVISYGLNDKKVIELSQELDRLILGTMYLKEIDSEV